MSEWSEETRKRLVEAARIDSDISTALAEVERLRAEAATIKAHFAEQARVGLDTLARAEAAEKEIERLRAEVKIWQSAAGINRNAEVAAQLSLAAERAKTAKLERLLREIAEDAAPGDWNINPGLNSVQAVLAWAAAKASDSPGDMRHGRTSGMLDGSVRCRCGLAWPCPAAAKASEEPEEKKGGR